MQITITENEIISNPNYFDLGKLVFNKYHKSKQNMITCPICDRNIANFDENELINCDHTECLMSYSGGDEYDNCVICGKTTPYTKNTHIDFRIGYVEGVGQTCPDPSGCKK